MKNLIALNLLLLSAFSASAQLTFNEIALNPGTAYSNPNKLTAINGTVYFQAEKAGQGTELWATDGTATGTRLIKDINPGTTSSTPHGFTDFNGKVYFIARSTNTVDELWETDGTEAGTKLIFSGITSDITVFNGKMYFNVQTVAEGNELWESDGTTSGTKLFKDINSGSDNSSPYAFIEYNNKLYFQAYDGTDVSLWCTDGTATGTTIALNSSTIAYNGGFCIFNNMLYFAATNGTGRMLYKSDGTNAGTAPVATLSTSSYVSSEGTAPVIYNNKLYFTHWNSNNVQLWSTDGTSAGTIKLKETGSSSDKISNVTVFNDKLYFVIKNYASAVLYNTDVTTGNTKTAEGFAPFGNMFASLNILGVYNGHMYFSAYSPYDFSNRLYAINADEELMNIKPAGNTVVNTRNNFYNYVYPFNNKLLTTAKFNENEGFELWSIEGTPTAISNTAAKTAQAFTLYPNPAKNVLHITTAKTYKQANITLTNTLGQVVLSETIDNNNTISLQGIAPGTYQATIDADGIRETQKLIIQ